MWEAIMDKRDKIFLAQVIGWASLQVIVWLFVHVTIFEDGSYILEIGNIAYGILKTIHGCLPLAICGIG